MLNELATFPLFLRFDNVKIWCQYDDRLNEEKCEFIENQLLPLKLALCDSNVVEFIATIFREGCRYFSDHSMLLDFIRNRFLPICNLSRRYKFKIYFFSDKNSATEIIASILEMAEIKQCSNVEIGITTGNHEGLPIEEILNWLEPSADVKKANLQNQKERFLKIFYYGISGLIQNAREMLKALTKVYFIYFFFGRLSF